MIFQNNHFSIRLIGQWYQGHVWMNLCGLKIQINQSLLDLYKKAGSKRDANLYDFIEGNFHGEQVDGIKDIGRVGESKSAWL